MEALAPAFAESTCPRHPDAPAVGACERCGSFVCARDAVKLGTKTYCSACAVRPDVDYLEAFRLKYWGQRDGWAWMFGLGGLPNLGISVALVVGLVSDRSTSVSDAVATGLTSAVLVVSGINGVLFWLGKPIARWGLLAVTVALGGIQVALTGPIGAVAMLIPLIVVANVFASWRCRLFFKLDVTRPTLQRAWDVLHNNTLARQSLIAGVTGLVIPFFGPVALIMGIIGFRRVDPNAYPPIGKKGYALAGIVFGAIDTLGWLAVLIAVLLNR